MKAYTDKTDRVDSRKCLFSEIKAGDKARKKAKRKEGDDEVKKELKDSLQVIKLTENQFVSLKILKTEQPLPLYNDKVSKNTMNSLYFKGLVKVIELANRKFWIVSQEGLNYLKLISNQTNKK